MSCIAVITARGGSQRIKDKNIKEFKGKPIIQYVIDEALESSIFDDVYVSTDSPKIIETIQGMGAIAFERPKALGKNDVGTQEVMGHVLTDLENEFNVESDYACCLYPCNPMLEAYELKQALSYLRFDMSLNYIVPVAQWLKDPGRWYFGRTKAFTDGIPLIGGGTRIMSVDPHRSIDINTMDDWNKAIKMWEALQ